MKFFSNLRFPSIDIDVVNNNESNRNLLHVSCSDLSPLGEAWLLTVVHFIFAQVNVMIIQPKFEPAGQN